MVNKCCVPNCGTKYSDPIPFHAFPNPLKDASRFRTWLYAIGGDILGLKNEEIFKKFAVCQNHFELKYVYTSKRLSANAVPTLHLAGGQPADASTTAEAQDTVQELKRYSPVTGRLAWVDCASESNAGVAIEQDSQADSNQSDDEDGWNSVAIVRGTSFKVQNYITAENVDVSSLRLERLPALSGLRTEALRANTVYRFRVAGINSVGRGKWSETSEFSTSDFGRPSAPTDIGIRKCREGARLSWSRAVDQGVFEYSVYLAVGVNTFDTDSELSFILAYRGAHSACVVCRASLARAFLRSTRRPSVVFRIAARNRRGYGPAAQLCWLRGSKRKSPDEFHLDDNVSKHSVATQTSED